MHLRSHWIIFLAISLASKNISAKNDEQADSTIEMRSLPFRTPKGTSRKPVDDRPPTYYILRKKVPMPLPPSKSFSDYLHIPQFSPSEERKKFAQSIATHQTRPDVTQIIKPSTKNDELNIYEQSKPCTSACSKKQKLDKIHWITSSWAKCKSHCGPQMQQRSAVCVNEGGEDVDSKYCEDLEKPRLVREFGSVTSCINRWYASEWSECTLSDMDGIRTRHVICGKFDGAELVSVLDPSQCSTQSTLPNIEPCSGEGFRSEWYTSPYGKCSSNCGSGFKRRKVFCFYKGKRVHDSKCDLETKPFEQEFCNIQSCTEDDLLELSGRTDIDFDSILGSDEESLAETTADKVLQMLGKSESKQIWNPFKLGSAFQNWATTLKEIKWTVRKLIKNMKAEKLIWFTKQEEGSGVAPENAIIDGIESPFEKLVLSYVLLKTKLKTFANFWQNAFQIRI